MKKKHKGGGNLGDEEVLRQYYELFENAIESLDNEDYVLDIPQLHKLIDAYLFFRSVAESCNGTVEAEVIEPRRQVGGITANFTLFYITGEEIARFSEVVKGFSAMSMDVVDKNKVCISVTVPGVYKRKN